jgi:hypothetical protein
MTRPDALDGEASPAGGAPVVAHLNGGPLDAQQRMLFRLRPRFVAPAPRGLARRLLGMHRRRVSYELQESWERDGMRHARYEYDSAGQ